MSEKTQSSFKELQQSLSQYLDDLSVLYATRYQVLLSISVYFDFDITLFKSIHDAASLKLLFRQVLFFVFSIKIFF